jgi:hypothetical protein
LDGIRDCVCFGFSWLLLIFRGLRGLASGVLVGVMTILTAAVWPLILKKTQILSPIGIILFEMTGRRSLDFIHTWIMYIVSVVVISYISKKESKQANI